MPDHKLEKNLSSHVICMHDMVLHTPCKPSYILQIDQRRRWLKYSKAGFQFTNHVTQKVATGKGRTLLIK